MCCAIRVHIIVHTNQTKIVLETKAAITCEKREIWRRKHIDDETVHTHENNKKNEHNGVRMTASEQDRVRERERCK